MSSSSEEGAWGGSRIEGGALEAVWACDASLSEEESSSEDELDAARR